MTDHDPFDDLASAHLDGVTTPEEAARIAADPILLARVEELRAVREAVAQPLAADPDRRERAITAALAVYDAEDDATTTAAAATLAPVRPMTPVAARRGAGGVWRVVGVAAAVAALVALVPILASLSDDSDRGSSDDVASAPEETQPEMGAATTPSTEAALDSGEITSTTTADAVPQPLGTFEDDDELAAAARSASPTTGAVSPETAGTFSAPPDPTSCVDELVAALPPGTIVSFRGTATVDGAPVAVVVTPDEVRIAGGDCTDVTVRAR